MKKKIIRFLVHAFMPYCNNGNPITGWNKDAFLTIGGLIIWGVCAVGEAYGIATTPAYVVGIGPFLLGMGVGRASKNKVE